MPTWHMIAAQANHGRGGMAQEAWVSSAALQQLAERVPQRDGPRCIQGYHMTHTCHGRTCEGPAIELGAAPARRVLTSLHAADPMQPYGNGRRPDSPSDSLVDPAYVSVSVGMPDGRSPSATLPPLQRVKGTGAAGQAPASTTPVSGDAGSGGHSSVGVWQGGVRTQGACARTAAGVVGA